VTSQPLMDLVEQSCTYLRKQRGRTDGGVKTYRWNLEQFLVFVRTRSGQLARPHGPGASDDPGVDR
jgi:hypothetical protein